MEKCIVRSFVIDGDICEIVFKYDSGSQRYIGDYPDFELNPRKTANGFWWVNATQDSCVKGVHKYYPEEKCLDCGSCSHFTTEKAGDLIGVCALI